MKPLLCLVVGASLIGCGLGWISAPEPLREDPRGDAGHDSGTASTLDSGVAIPDSDAPSPTPDAGTPTAGTFPEKWIHGSSSCASNMDPSVQIHAFDANTYILRQNKCVHFEAPFIYLLFGQNKVLMLDSGATADSTRFPIQKTVRDIMAARGQAGLELIVAHSHSHSDHTAGDGQFAGQPNTSVVGSSLAAVQAFFGITAWPTQVVPFDLGGRTLQVIPLPGHDASHIAFYDPNTKWLLTGDSVYPGRLYVRDWAAYRTSIARLVTFMQDHSVSNVMGTHVEMSNTPGVDYPAGSTFQPQEHALQLSPADLLELNDALIKLGPTPTREVHPAFIVQPI